jgi:Rrf2 family protein
MAVNTQFSIAAHLMTCLAYMDGKDATSADLACSVNTSPSFVRRVLAKLSRAGLVDTATGKAGACWLAKNPREISLLDVYRAVDAPRAFTIHHYDVNKPCVVSCHIKSALEKALNQTQKGMEESLAKISVADVLADIKRN